MNTGQIFEEMRARKLTPSLRAWSREWLGRCHNFASIHRDDPLPPDSLIRLRARLLKEGHADLAAKLLLVLLGELPPAGAHREVQVAAR